MEEQKKQDWTSKQSSTNKKGFTSENTQKLFKWEGKKELVWIFGILVIIAVAFAYYTETKSCKEMQKTECFNDCMFEIAIEKIQKANPTATVTCDREVKICTVSGMDKNNLQLPEIGGFAVNYTKE